MSLTNNLIGNDKLQLKAKFKDKEDNDVTNSSSIWEFHSSCLSPKPCDLNKSNISVVNDKSENGNLTFDPDVDLNISLNITLNSTQTSSRSSCKSSGAGSTAQESNQSTELLEVDHSSQVSKVDCDLTRSVSQLMQINDHPCDADVDEATLHCEWSQTISKNSLTAQLYDTSLEDESPKSISCGFSNTLKLDTQHLEHGLSTLNDGGSAFCETTKESALHRQSCRMLVRGKGCGERASSLPKMEGYVVNTL